MVCSLNLLEMEIRPSPSTTVDWNLSQPSLDLQGEDQLSFNRGNFRTTQATILLSVAPCSPWDPSPVTGAAQQAICASAWMSLMAARRLVLMGGMGQGCTATPAAAQGWVSVEWWRSWAPGYQPSCGISSCTLTSTLNLHESEVMLSEVTVGLRLLLAGLPSIPKDWLLPSGTVLPCSEADLLSASCQQQGYLVVALRGGLSTWLCPCIRVTQQLGCTSPFTVAVLFCSAGSGLLASPKLCQHSSQVLPKKTTQTLLCLFLCFWIVGGKICFMTAEIVWQPSMIGIQSFLANRM